MNNYNANRDLTSYEKGEMFEKYIQDVLFPMKDYDLLEKTHNYEQNKKRFVKSTKNPDFKFKCRKTGREFYVEAKYRSGKNDDDLIKILSSEQAIRYEYIHSAACPIIIIVGYEGTADNPRTINIIPYEKLPYTDLYENKLKEFTFYSRSSISPYELWKRVGIPIGREYKAPFSKTNIKDNENSKWQAPPTKEPKAVKEERSKWQPPLNDRKEDPVKEAVSDKTEEIVKPKRKLNKVNVLVSLCAIVGLGLASLYFFDKPNKNKIDEGKIKNQIRNYYAALENNNIEVLDYYVNKKVDRWYSKRGVSLQAIKLELKRYYKKYPIHSTKLVDNSVQISPLPDGNVNAVYELYYTLQKKGSNTPKKYHLMIYSIWSPELKLKSIYEDKL